MSFFAETLKSGGIGVFPCDTVWGILGLCQENVVARICDLKQRPRNMGFVVLIPNLDALNLLCGDLNSAQQNAVEMYWPGPVSLVLPKSDALPDIVCGGRAGVAVRMPDFEPLNSELTEIGIPVVSTSANLHGGPLPQAALEIDERILAGVDAIFEGVDPPLGVASRIVDCMGDTISVLREGP